MLFTFHFHSGAAPPFSVSNFVSDSQISTPTNICTSHCNPTFLHAACTISPHVITSSTQQATCVLSFAFTCLSQNKSYMVTSNWNKSWVGSVPPFYLGENLWAAMWRAPCKMCFSLPSWCVKSTSAHGPEMDMCSHRIHPEMFHREGLLREVLRAQDFKCWNSA